MKSGFLTVKCYEMAQLYQTFDEICVQIWIDFIGFQWRTNWHTMVQAANNSGCYDKITTVIQGNLYE